MDNIYLLIPGITYRFYTVRYILRKSLHNRWELFIISAKNRLMRFFSPMSVSSVFLILVEDGQKKVVKMDSAVKKEKFYLDQIQKLSGHTIFGISATLTCQFPEASYRELAS